MEEPYGKLRIHLTDGSFIDIWFSRTIPGRYAYHWERRHVDGTIYRQDNRPHEGLRHLQTYPKHVHNGSDENIEPSRMSDNPEEAAREFLEFARKKLKPSRQVAS